MNTADRRAEIISILMVRRRITAKELAEEFNVTVRTIQNDIQALSPGFPIYTRQGGDGGIFVGDNYKPYMNTCHSCKAHNFYNTVHSRRKWFMCFLD